MGKKQKIFHGKLLCAVKVTNLRIISDSELVFDDCRALKKLSKRDYDGLSLQQIIDALSSEECDIGEFLAFFELTSRAGEWVGALEMLMFSI